MRFFAWFALLTTAGCGLGSAGLGPDLTDAATPGSGDGAVTHAGTDGGISPDAPVPFDGNATGATDGAPTGMDAIATDAGGGDVVPIADMDGASCKSLIPSGWTVVVYDVGAGSCPSGFGAHSVHGTPVVVGADACPCACAVTQTGSCDQGSLSTLAGRGNGSMCNQSWISATIAGSGCTPVQALPGPLPRFFQASPLLGTGGACSDSVQPDVTKVSAPSALYCDVPGSSADSVCVGVAPSGFASCIGSSGMTTCPPGTPFTQRYVVEDNATAQCSACSACSVATACANASLTTYTDPMCSLQGTPLTVDGTCTTIGGLGFFQNVAAVTYTATASSTCTHGTSTPAAQLTNPQTICCR